MRDHTADRPGDDHREPGRAAWFPPGAQIGGVVVETVAKVTRPASEHIGEHLVQLTTDAGRLTSVPGQLWRVRRRGTATGAPYGEPEWLPAGSVRLGDHLCRPRHTGPDLWYPVKAVTVLAHEGRLYRYETDADTVLADGFLARTEPVPARGA